MNTDKIKARIVELDHIRKAFDAERADLVLQLTDAEARTKRPMELRLVCTYSDGIVCGRVGRVVVDKSGSTIAVIYGPPGCTPEERDEMAREFCVANRMAHVLRFKLGFDFSTWEEYTKKTLGFCAPYVSDVAARYCLAIIDNREPTDDEKRAWGIPV